MLAWTVDRSQHMDITLTDSHGLTNREPIAYRIDAMADQPPQVTITEPSGDEIVLPTALVALRTEASDDVILHALAIEAAIEPKSPDVIPEAGWAETTSADSPAAALEAVLDLQALEAKTGDVVVVTAIAEDTFDVDGIRHEPSRSTPRRLRVIDELEFASQLRRELGAVRQNAIRIEAMQAELQASIVEDSLQPGVQRAQAQIAERIADQREALDEVADRVESNRLEDAQLAELIRQSAEMLDFAGRAAGEAMSAIEDIEDRPAAGQNSDPANQAAESETGEPVEAREEDQPIVEAQQEVREELTDLIELLDRDEDTWVVTRRMEGLLAEQRELQRQTRAMENRTMGRDRDDLSEAERDELDRIAQRQRALRDRSQELIEELRDRAQALEPIDSQSAEGMRNAADSAEREQLDQEMEAAAEQAQQNQLRNAQSAQQSASQTLERMLDEIQEIKRARTEELVRKIQALKESIEQLISVQENELSALARAIHEESFSGRDRAMIRLNQNTRSVAGEARSAGQETQRVARALDRAGDAQGEAITALRATPVDPAAAESAETHSLERLNEALALADAIEQQAQEEQVRQQREELIAAYRELAEREVVIHTETQGLGDGSEPLGRRALVDARLLAGRQDAVKNELRVLHDSTEQVAEALIFDHAHQMMDRWAGDVGDALREGVVGPVVTDRQQLIADSIGRLIDALEESMTPPDEFASNSQQGGGAGSGQGGQPQLIPPVSELKLLRGIQEQIYNQTKRLDADGSISDGSRRARMRDLGDQQRDLLDIGRQMMDRMNQQSRQRPAVTPIEDADDNEEADS